MIERGQGNLLQADTDAVVNTVNTVGIMGKGIALQFKQAFPDNYDAYRAACERNEVQPGRMFVFVTGRLRPRLIVNFPTKRHWRQPSRLADIDAGLQDLVRVIREHHIDSIAIPPLGAGNGGLDWTIVRPRILAALRTVPDVAVKLYEPGGTPEAKAMPVAARTLKLTRARAAMLALFARYSRLAFTLGRLEAQKLVYLMKAAGEPFRNTQFTKGKYGPYAESLNHALAAMDGQFLRGYGDRHAVSDILIPEASEAAAVQFLNDHPDARLRINRVLQVIDGYEHRYGMELLGTVHWVGSVEVPPAMTAEQAVAAVAGWNAHKRDRYKPIHVNAAWHRLHDEGFLGAPQPPPAD